MARKGGLHLGYQDHYVVDGGKARIILGVLVTPGDVMENQPFLDLLWRARCRWKLPLHQITGDTTEDNVVSVNYIGTDQTGSFALGGGGNGIEIDGATEKKPRAKRRISTASAPPCAAAGDWNQHVIIQR